MTESPSMCHLSNRCLRCHRHHHVHVTVKPWHKMTSGQQLAMKATKAMGIAVSMGILVEILAAIAWKWILRKGAYQWRMSKTGSVSVMHFGNRPLCHVPAVSFLPCSCDKQNTAARTCLKATTENHIHENWDDQDISVLACAGLA